MLGADNECYLCRKLEGWSNTERLDTHHIFEGGTSGRRAMSEKYGLTVKLCKRHHNMSNISVHANPNKGNDLLLKQVGQRYYEEHIGTRDDFRRDFIKSYL